MSLADKKALVTGGKRHIGRGIALALAEAGCDVAINDIEGDADAEETLELVRGMGRRASFYEADISSSDQVRAMMDGFLDEFGAIDILVNNPFFSKPLTFLEVTEDAWDRTLEVCLKGYFLCSQRAAREMVEREQGGSIVSISSVHADRSFANSLVYGVAKAGIDRLTEGMAVELAPYGVRCNAVLPGYMDTGHAFGSAPPAVGSAPDHLRPLIPTGRPSTPEDIGRAVTFLCSPAAANITGHAIPVDGGLLHRGPW